VSPNANANGDDDGPPAANVRVEFYRHQLGDEEASSWQRVLSTLFLTLGPQVAAFEGELGRFLVRGRSDAEAPFVVGTSACSMGLLLALRALDVKPGDEVITTPMTFAATANAILHLGATPKLVDVERETGLIDPAAVHAAVGPSTVGILPVHLYGQLADMKALRAIADRHGLFLVEDSAHGVEIERDGIRPGDLSNAAVFSFYATKNLTSGDGGAVVTRDAQMRDRLRRLRNHGGTKAAADRHGGSYQHWDIVELGYKANLTDLDAALLLPQLAHAPSKRARREAIDGFYRSALRERIADFAMTPPAGQGVPWVMARRGTSSHHLFTVHARRGERDALLAKLGARGVGTAVNYRALHTLTYFARTLGVPRGALPVAEEIGDRTISLPMFPTLTQRELDHVVGAVAHAWSELAAERA
jgi:dTDP-4-amino-4,6-dideoxygalactose transaminase